MTVKQLKWLVVCGGLIALPGQIVVIASTIRHSQRVDELIERGAATSGGAKAFITESMALMEHYSQYRRWGNYVALFGFTVAGVAGFKVFRKEKRDRHRIQQGLCLNCGYNLTGNESGICPECGESCEGSLKA